MAPVFAHNKIRFCHHLLACISPRHLSENRSRTGLLCSKGGLLPFLSEHARIRVHSENKAMDNKKRAGILRPAQMRHLLRVTEATSRHPERDSLVLLLGLTCAMRVTEIAKVGGNLEMLAQKTYDATAVGAVGTMTHGGMIAVGQAADDAGYERFASFVADLEAMENQGLVRIESRNHESQTGQNHIDQVRFTRLK